jgi:hypothetical protein
LNVNEKEQTHSSTLEILKHESSEDLFIFARKIKQPIRFTLLEIETAIGESLNNDELKRFGGSRFTQIERSLEKPLNDLQRWNLLKGDKLTIESLIGRKLSLEETGKRSFSTNFLFEKELFRTSYCHYNRD